MSNDKLPIEILEQPQHFQLWGISGEVQNEQYGPVGLQLMDALWQAVRTAGLKTAGVNHWVYLPDSQMFVGVELLPDQPPPSAPLTPLAFELPRALKHIHVGPYQELPQKWKALFAELNARGEQPGPVSLEVYGHHCEEPSKQETTILIGLQNPQQSR